MIRYRRYRSNDASALLDLFRHTVRKVNARDYTPDQIAAWAPDDIDPEAWERRFEGRFVVVAEEDARPLGFAELEDDGHVDRFFVSADRQRCGIGRHLLEMLAAQARRVGLTRLYLEASITAKPFFEANGFITLAEQQVPLRGQVFDNFRMELPLAEGDSACGAREAPRSH